MKETRPEGLATDWERAHEDLFDGTPILAVSSPGGGRYAYLSEDEHGDGFVVYWKRDGAVDPVDLFQFRPRQAVRLSHMDESDYEGLVQHVEQVCERAAWKAFGDLTMKLTAEGEFEQGGDEVLAEMERRERR